MTIIAGGNQWAWGICPFVVHDWSQSFSFSILHPLDHRRRFVAISECNVAVENLSWLLFQADHFFKNALPVQKVRKPTSLSHRMEQRSRRDMILLGTFASNSGSANCTSCPGDSIARNPGSQKCESCDSKTEYSGMRVVWTFLSIIAIGLSDDSNTKCLKRPDCQLKDYQKVLIGCDKSNKVRCLHFFHLECLTWLCLGHVRIQSDRTENLYERYWSTTCRADLMRYMQPVRILWLSSSCRRSMWFWF